MIRTETYVPYENDRPGFYWRGTFGCDFPMCTHRAQVRVYDVHPMAEPTPDSADDTWPWPGRVTDALRHPQRGWTVDHDRNKVVMYCREHARPTEPVFVEATEETVQMPVKLTQGQVHRLNHAARKKLLAEKAQRNEKKRAQRREQAARRRARKKGIGDTVEPTNSTTEEN